MRAHFVGRSVVSAITHTPASGCPVGERTTPPISSLSMAGTELASCARAGVMNGAVPSAAKPIAATLEDRIHRRFIAASIADDRFLPFYSSGFGHGNAQCAV